MIRIKLIIIIALTSTIVLKGQSKDFPIYKTLDPYYFHLQFITDSNSILIDVREFFEYKGNRIKGALNIPSSGNTEFSADTTDRNLNLFFYCSTGFRSKRVAELFFNKGFRKVFNLEGGIVAWKRDGFPVEKGKVRRKR